MEKNYKEMYEDLFARIKKVFDTTKSQEVIDMLGENFRKELYESEDDRIKRDLIGYFKDGQFLYHKKEDILAWLEKQGEQSKKHDVCDNCDQQGSCVSPCPMKLVEKQGEEIIPLKEIILNVWELGNEWKELTKGVCNTEHGTQLDYIIKHWKEGEYYVGSFGKQGEQKSEEVDNLHNYLYGEHKSSWSEEDEINLEKAIWYVGNPAPMVAKDSMLVEWIKSLKGRVQPQPRQEWSEEDEKHINSLLDRLKGLCKNEFTRTTFAVSEDEDWLKSLRNIVLPQPKQECSEEDKKMFKNLCSILSNLSARKLIEKETEKKYVDWLKSLRPNHWKPTEEQMKALETTLYSNMSRNDKRYPVLSKFVVELKKLKE